MLNRNKRSFNLQSFNIDQLPIKRILLLALMAYLLIFVEALVLTSYRMLSLPYALTLFCSEDADFFVICVNEVIQLVLFSWQWSATKFSIYVFSLTPLLYLLMVRQKGSIVSSMLLLITILLMAIAVSFKPPWVELVSVLMSGLLATCFIKKNNTL
jgi:hypothetical protein